VMIDGVILRVSLAPSPARHVLFGTCWSLTELDSMLQVQMQFQHFSIRSKYEYFSLVTTLLTKSKLAEITKSCDDDIDFIIDSLCEF